MNSNNKPDCEYPEHYMLDIDDVKIYRYFKEETVTIVEFSTIFTIWNDF